MFKSLSLTVVAFMATSSFASAESYFQHFSIEHDKSGHIEVGLVRAESAGVVEIYEFHRGEVGDLMGSVPVNAGANTHVHVNVTRPVDNEAVAYLRINGEVVDTEEIDFK